MKYRGRNAKRDRNEKEIADFLVTMGAKVERLSGTGIPDLLVGFRGCNYLLEVKAKRGTLEPDQVEFHDEWPGQIAVVRSVAEAVDTIMKPQKETDR